MASVNSPVCDSPYNNVSTTTAIPCNYTALPCTTFVRGNPRLKRGKAVPDAVARSRQTHRRGCAPVQLGSRRDPIVCLGKHIDGDRHDVN